MTRSAPQVITGVASALLACGALSVAACRGTNANATPVGGQPTRIIVSKVKQESVRRAVDVVGTLVAFDEATISSEGEGKVVRILADLGDRVKAGQPLVELDREKSEYRLAQQQAALERAMAKYGVSDASADLPAIEKTPDVQKAAAELAQAERNFSRASELNRRNLVPKQ